MICQKCSYQRKAVSLRQEKSHAYTCCNHRRVAQKNIRYCRTEQQQLIFIKLRQNAGQEVFSFMKVFAVNVTKIPVSIYGIGIDSVRIDTPHAYRGGEFLKSLTAYATFILKGFAKKPVHSRSKSSLCLLFLKIFAALHLSAVNFLIDISRVLSFCR